MRSTLVLMSVIGIFGLAMAVIAQSPTEAPSVRFKQVETLQRQYGNNHPRVREAVEALAEATFEMPILVSHGNSSWVAMRRAQLLSFGSREFLVGIEFETKHTKPMFLGKRTWVPIDTVTCIVELEQAEPVGGESGS